MNKTPQTYKQLPQKEEIELVRWLGFFNDSVRNALVQKRRWKSNHSFWDIKMFFVALINIDDAIVGLKKFLDYDDRGFWEILKSFRKDISRLNLGDLRNDLLHRNKIFKQQDKKGNPLPKSPILILGGYNFSNDEYRFGTHVIKMSDTFLIVQQLIRDTRKLFKERLREYYDQEQYEAIIPWTEVRSLMEVGKPTKNIVNKLRHIQSKKVRLRSPV